MYEYIILDYGSQDATIVTDIRTSRQNDDNKMIKASRQRKFEHNFKARCVSEAEKTRYQTSHHSHRNRWRTMNDFEENLKSGSLIMV
jgi:hypothetical protein